MLQMLAEMCLKESTLEAGRERIFGIQQLAHWTTEHGFSKPLGLLCLSGSKAGLPSPFESHGSHVWLRTSFYATWNAYKDFDITSKAKADKYFHDEVEGGKGGRKLYR